MTLSPDTQTTSDAVYGGLLQQPNMHSRSLHSDVNSGEAGCQLPHKSPCSRLAARAKAA